MSTVSSSTDKRSDSERIQDQTILERQVKELFMLHPELSVTDLVQRLTGKLKFSKDLHMVLNHMETTGLLKHEPLSGGKWISLMLAVGVKTEFSSDPRIPSGILFNDWMNVIPQLLKCYELKINTMLIGPKATGKTQSIRKLAELVNQPLEYENFSLRTREHHFIGRLDPRPDGTVGFKAGSLLKSMQDGCIWYGDEVNVAEADSLIRLDEATDDRRQLTIEGETIHARDSWWCVSSINPLSHAGTKELPPQLLSRFPVRIYFTYPDIDSEMEIIRMHCPGIKGTQVLEMRKIVEATQQLRTLDVPYTPGVRETVAMGKLLESGVSAKNAVSWCLVNVYYQYDESIVKRVTELLTSRGLTVA